MASKVLSIEIGYSLTKVLEIDYKVKNPKVYSSFVIETPSDLFKDDVVTDHPIFSEAIRARLHEYNIKTKNVVFTISSNRIATREIPLPSSVKDARIQSLIEMNAKDYFPIDVTDYKLSYTMLRQNVVEGIDEKKYILVLAAPKVILDSYVRFGRTCGLETVALDYSGNALFQAIKNDCNDDKTKMVIKVDEKNSFCMVLKGKDIIFTRNIAYGIDDAVEAIIANKNFEDINTYLDAVDYARAKTCIYSSYNTPQNGKGDDKKTGDATQDTQAMWDAKCKVTAAFSSLTGGINRVIDFYKSKFAEEPLSNIYVTGIGADFSGLQKLIGNETGIETKVFTNFDNVKFDKSTKELPLGEYITCIGATINPVSFFLKEGEAKKQAKGKDYIGASILFFILCVAISAVLILFAYIDYSDEKTKAKNYENNVIRYAGAYETYEQYLNSKASYEKLEAFSKDVDGSVNHIVEFINEMEQSMPSSLRVQSLAATNSGLTMSVTVDSKEAVATLVEKLNKFESVKTAEVTSVSITTNEIGEEVCSFSVSIEFKSVSADSNN